MSITLLNVLIAGMVFVTMLLLVAGVLGGAAREVRPLEQRLARMGYRSGSDRGDAATSEEARSNEALQKALQELEALKKAEGHSYIRVLLKGSGNLRTLRAHVLISVVVGVLVFGVALAIGLNLWLALLVGAALGVILPILQLRRAFNHRLAMFTEDLPGALDLTVRGIRAGLPLLECLKLTAAEWREPLKSEFMQIINDMGIGLSIKDAVGRFADRVPLQEAKLFAIVIAIQSQSGGNLSEVLSNLSDLLRERSKLHAKIKAMTSEARTSAWIIGSIPFVLIGAVSTFSPGFLDPLFNTSGGTMVLIGSGVWMLIGMIVMSAMMKVDL